MGKKKREIEVKSKYNNESATYDCAITVFDSAYSNESINSMLCEIENQLRHQILDDRYPDKCGCKCHR